MSVRSIRYNTIEQHFTKGVTASTDRDALAFLEAAQIYNANQQRAIVNLVRSLKRVGLWTKMKAIYPFVGGTASSHKWNLKDPRDADAAFRLSFQGGWTHSSTGADPNGTNGYADTFLKPSTLASQDSAHASAYIPLSQDDRVLYGVNQTPGNTRRFFLYAPTSISDIASTVNTTYTGVQDYLTYTDSNRKGMFLGNRTNSVAHRLHVNGVNVASKNFTSSAGAAFNLYFATVNTDGVPAAGQYTTNEFRFATIGDGLTDTDASNLYNIVDLYQRRLGRNV